MKEWYAEPNDRFEVPLYNYVIDIVRGDLLVEIQTRNFAAMEHKLNKLAIHHSVRLVYPIAQEKWIVKLSGDRGDRVSRRKSPRRGTIEDVFNELVSFPELLLNHDFSIEVLLIKEEEYRRYDNTRGWRKKGWTTYKRRLLQVVEKQFFRVPSDMGSLLLSSLIESFTTYDLAISMKKSHRLAQKMLFRLRLMGCVIPAGKRGNTFLCSRIDIYASLLKSPTARLRDGVIPASFG